MKKNSEELTGNNEFAEAKFGFIKLQVQTIVQPFIYAGISQEFVLREITISDSYVLWNWPVHSR